MQSNVASRSQPAEEGSMLPCSVCGTYSKRAKFYSHAEPKCSSESDDAGERSRSSAIDTRRRVTDNASSLAIDSQATVIVSQSQSWLTIPHKRSAAAIQLRVICRRCRLNPRDPSSLSEDLVGRHSS